MKTLFVIVVSVLLTSTLMFSTVASAEETSTLHTQSIIIHLSKYSNDLHAVNMALKIGHLMAKDGSDVTLFLDLEGVRLVDKKAPINLKWGSGESVKDLYNNYVDAGGKVLVCPHCAKAAGVEDLRKGAVIANNESLAKAISQADKVLDY